MKSWRGIRRDQSHIRIDLQHKHIVHELTWAQVHILDKEYPGRFIKRRNKSEEFENTNRKAKSHSVDYPIS